MIARMRAILAVAATVIGVIEVLTGSPVTGMMLTAVGVLTAVWILLRPSR